MSDDPNKWSRNPAPLFFNQLEKDLNKQIADELAEVVIRQQILYFPIDVELTNYHPLYGEAIKKNFLNPIQVYCFVLWEGEFESSEDPFMADRKAKITAHFLTRRLTDDKNLEVRLGDFLLWGSRYFEIVKLEEPRQHFGQPDQNFSNFEITAKCIQTRKGKFDGI